MRPAFPMRIGVLALPVLLAATSGGHGQDCIHTITLFDDFAFRASSDHGAVGDVVAIELSLRVENLHGGIYYYSMNIAYDDMVVEPIGAGQFSEIHEQLVLWELSNQIPEDYRLPGVHGKALSISALFAPFMVDDYFEAGNILPIATIYFRLVGQPGESSLIRFSDGEFKWPGNLNPCIENSVGFYNTKRDAYINARSIQNIPGEIRIVPGEATHTEVPSSPPLAKVYSVPPSPETANVYFELTGGNVRPGAIEVPVNLFVTSKYEFSSYQAAGTFPNQYLMLQRIEDHTRPRVQHIDNLAGEFWVTSDLSRWRIGLENERILVATLYFNVSQNAPDGAILPLELKNVGSVERVYLNLIGINNESTDGPRIPIVTEVEPLVITQSVLNIRSTENTILGDANLDSIFDISDPVTVIAYMLQGGVKPACPAAADYNTDGKLDIADAISMLMALFLGGSSGGNATVEVACE